MRSVKQRKNLNLISIETERGLMNSARGRSRHVNVVPENVEVVATLKMFQLTDDENSHQLKVRGKAPSELEIVEEL